MALTKEYTSKKCGIRFSPPALIVVYEDERQNLRKCVMPVRNFKVKSSVSFIAEDLKTRHKVLSTVPSITIEKMLRLIQEHMNGLDLSKALEFVNKEFTVNSEEDLNKFSGDVLARKKRIMDQIFNKNRIKPDDPDFVYDKRVDFNPEQASSLDAGWDDDVDDFWN